MLKRLFAILLIVTMMASLAACGSQAASPTPTPVPAPAPAEGEDTGDSAPAENAETPENLETIKIGGVWPLTGKNKSTGDYSGEGAILAVEQINAAGGLLGGRQVELIIEDDMETQQQSVNATQKLLAAGEVVALYQGINSTNGIAVSGLIREAQIPHMTGGSSTNIFKEQNPWVWQVRMTDDKTGVVMAKAAVDNLKMTKPAILYINDSFGQGLADVLIPNLKELGVEPAGVFTFAAEELQMAPIITQVLATGCDGVIAISTDPPAPLIIKEMANQAGDIPCLGTTGFSTSVTIDLAGDDAVGWYVCSDWSTKIESPETQAFVEAYNERWGREPQFTSAVVYDSYMLLAEAIRRAGSAEPAAINEELGKIQDYPGALTTLSANEMRSFSTAQYLTQNTKQADGSITGDVISTIPR